jgi:hypothetical protein
MTCKKKKKVFFDTFCIEKENRKAQSLNILKIEGNKQSETKGRA